MESEEEEVPLEGDSPHPERDGIKGALKFLSLSPLNLEWMYGDWQLYESCF